MDSIITSTTRQILSAALDVTSAAHKLIANNIANVNTKHFNPSHVDFRSTMIQVERTLSSVERSSVESVGTSAMPLVVTVDTEKEVLLDQEMLALSQNVVRYQALAEAMQGLGNVSKIAITGGKS